MVDSMALSVDIASMISSLNNHHGYKIDSNIVFDYILFGAIRTTLIRRELYKNDSNFLTHYNESIKVYSNRELLEYADQYINLLDCNLVNVIDKSFTSIIRFKYYLYLRLSVYFSTFARIPSNLTLFYYRLERKIFVYFLRLL